MIIFQHIHSRFGTEPGHVHPDPATGRGVSEIRSFLLSNDAIQLFHPEI
jgi:hypothetical protein